MSERSDIVNKYNHLIKTFDRKTVSSVYPNDIEVYLCALELVDSNRNTEAYFVFPIQPSSIQKSEPTRTNIKKSMSGTTILRNSSFIPQEISIKGNFGRKFKILNGLDGFGFGNAIGDALGVFKSTSFEVPSFSYSIKNGFGCIKLLQSIFQSSQKSDKYGKSKRLIFYNLGLGETYMVTIPPSGYSFSQTEDQNMIWSYQANMTIVAPLTFMNDQGSLPNDTTSIKLVSSSNFIDKPRITAKKNKNILSKYQDKLDEFKKKTGANIELFLNDFNFFEKNHYSNIVNFFGNGGNLVRESFNFLDHLIKESKSLESLIEDKLPIFDSVAYWDIVDIYEDIKEDLNTCYNLKRLLRSSNNRNSSTVEFSNIQKQNETFENISKKYGFSNPDSDVELLLSNQIIEEDYTNQGGKMLNVRIPNNSTFSLENIVDTLTYENIYGKDIICKLEIQSDGGLTTLVGKDSLRQTFSTIMSTIKGSIPEFPNDGIPDYIYGSNKNIIQYPIIFRSLLSMIQKDKRFTRLELLDINKDQDSVFLEFQASTITENVLINNLTI